MKNALIPFRGLAGLSLAVGLLCLTAARSSAVPNGVPVSAPEVVHLWLGHGAHDCTGTLIGPNTILTAAHCLVGLNPEDPGIEVTVSEPGAFTLILHTKEFAYNPAYRQVYDPKKDDEGSKVREIIDYVNTKNVDVGVIKIDGPMVKLLKYLPIKTDRQPSDLVGADVAIIGRANDQPDSVDDNLAHVARKGTNRILAEQGGVLFMTGMSPGRIERVLKKGGKPTGENVGIGSGDSGSPMLASEAVVGVNVGVFIDQKDRDLLRKIIGETGATLQGGTTIDQDAWTFTAALSDPKNISFLQSAREQGYEIPSLGAPPAPAASHAARPLAFASPTLRQLQSMGAETFVDAGH